MKIAKIFIIVLLASITGAVAQPKGEDLNQKNKNAFHKEVNTFMDEEVMPVIKTWRKEFDAKLTDDEKATINEIRVSFVKNRDEAIEMVHVVRVRLLKEGHGPSEGQTAKKAEMDTERQALMDQLTPIVNNYREEMRIVIDTHQAQLENWQQSLDAIQNKHLGGTTGNGEDHHAVISRLAHRQFLLLESN